MINLNQVTKIYEGRNYHLEALSEIDLTIPHGQFVSIIGKSGSGKSSLIKIMGLLDMDFEGEYHFDEQSIEELEDREYSLYRRGIGYIFQDFQLIDRYTVRRNLEVASVIKSGIVDQQEIESTLIRVGMEDKLESYPDELSGGQKQRIAIARAILFEPKLIIADEPTGAIDEENSANIMQLLQEIHNLYNPTIILVTHDMEVARIAQRIIQLESGRIKNDTLLY